ncbi:MAG TPA: 50S ribosomal protein L21 [Gammaproteobacteria bacterium]|nr:50S ribosomal protein L21 [Gammaproteobacteria bacterium]
MGAYAVIKSGGKQYRVQEGQYLHVAKIEQETGATVTFDQILLVGEGDSVKIGNPLVTGYKVTGIIEEQGREDKIRIIKIKRRKHHMKRMGHRQWYTQVRITAIEAA